MWQQQMHLVQKELGDRQRKKPIPFPLPTIGYVVSVSRHYSNPQARFLFNWLYLTGQRISEALRVRRADITYEERGDAAYVVVNSITLKNRNQPRRVLPLPHYGAEKPMVQQVYERIEDLDYDERIFRDLNRKSAWYILQKQTVRIDAIMPNDNTMKEIEMAIYPHYLRHCRASHLAQYRGYDLYQLMQYFGWSSPNVATVYATLNWQSLAEQMERGSNM